MIRPPLTPVLYCTLLLCLWVVVQGLFVLVHSWPAYAVILRASASQHGTLLIAMAPILGLAALIALAWATFIRVLYRRTRGLARVFTGAVLALALWILLIDEAGNRWDWLGCAALLALFLALLRPMPAPPDDPT